MDWTSIINNTVSTVGGILSGSGGAQGGPPFGGLPPFNPYPPQPEPTNTKIDNTTLLIGLGVLLFILKK